MCGISSKHGLGVLHVVSRPTIKGLGVSITMNQIAAGKRGILKDIRDGVWN